jgi:uncharacterized caspase-like protein
MSVSKKNFRFTLIFGLFIVSISNISAQKSKPPCARLANYPRKIHALVVGISNYENHTPLSFCHKDAKAFNNFLLNESANESQIGTINLLTNEIATKSNIFISLKGICDNAQPQDVLIFYFSGLSAKDGLLYYGSKENDDLVTYTWLKETLRRSPAQVKIMVLDVGHSNSTTDAANTASANSLFNKETDNGLCVITATENRQNSIENPSLGMGYFTDSFIQGLRNVGDITSQKRKGRCITLQDAFNYTQSSVNTATKGKQTPNLVGGIPNDFVLWYR